MKTKNGIFDEKVTRKSVTPSSFLAVFLTLMFLAIGQSFIIVIYFGSNIIPPRLLGSLMIYWAVVTAAFSFLTAINIRKRYTRPIQLMSEVTEKVAAGDFTARLEIYHKDGKLDYLDAMFLDFNKMVDELASIEILKNDFVSNVSHEIKTPLAVMQNYATLLQNDSLSEMQRKEYSQIIFDATQQLSSLVTNILRLSKLENQSITQACKPYDVCGQLGECVLAFAERLEEKNIQFSVDMEDKAMVLADESLVEIIWNNLLSNAIKFTPDGGTIQLTQTSNEDCVLISVRDTGCGMKPETMKHIFDKFYQGDTSHSGVGNGLGLALVKRVIDLIGGEISVTSEYGNGTIFTVKLRRAENETDKKNTA